MILQIHNRSHNLAPFNSFFSQTTLDCFHYLELFATTKQIYIPTKAAGTVVVPLISNYILVLLCVISLNYILHVTITLEPSTLELFLVVKVGTELGRDSIRIFNHKYIEGKCTWLSSGHTLGIWICGCSLFYRRELWVSKSVVFKSTKSLTICGWRSWCPKDLRLCTR